jgi:hypothetical protein
MNRIRAVGPLRTFENESMDLLTRFTTNATGARAVIIDDTIRQLKAVGVWSKLDAFYMLAAAASDQALLNWKSASFTCTTNGTITFTADQGYAGNGSTGYLDTNFNPSTAGGGFAQNSVHLGLYSRSSIASTELIGNQAALLIPRNGSNAFVARLHRTSSFNIVGSGLTTGAGYFAASRLNSTVADGIVGTTIYTNVSNVTNTAPANANLWVCSWNGTAPVYGTAQIACAHFGSGLTSGELLAISGIVTSHLARIGAAV